MAAYAMVLPGPGLPLERRELPIPSAAADGQVLLAVEACAVCRTDLHLLDGELPDIPYPIVPGHEIVARVLSLGRGVTGLQAGGISPLALLNKGFQVVMDVSAQPLPRIHISGGQRGLNIAMTPHDLFRLVHARYEKIID